MGFQLPHLTIPMEVVHIPTVIFLRPLNLPPFSNCHDFINLIRGGFESVKYRLSGKIENSFIERSDIDKLLFS